MTMIYELIKDENFDSAFEFFRYYYKIFNEMAIERFGEDWDDYFTYYNVVEALIEEFGSDYDLLECCIDNLYDDDKYFILIDYNEEKDGFRIRIWKNEKIDKLKQKITKLEEEFYLLNAEHDELLMATDNINLR